MKYKFAIDYWLLVPVTILIAIGLTTLAAISSLYFRNQIFSLVISLISFFIISQINISVLKSLKLPVYIASLILLFIVLIIGIESRGAVRWIELFGIRAQFSELLKPLLAISLASFIADKKNPTFKTFLFLNLLLFPIITMIYLQPDLGSALIYAAVFFLTLVILGFPLRWFGILLLCLLLFSPLFWNNLHEYQRQRVMTFLQPHKDPLGASYNSMQAMIALGSGMFAGKGLGESTQSGLRFLPERHTDFIFAAISEGMGFMGALIVILAFLFLFLHIYNIFKNSSNIFEKTFLVLSSLFLLIQFFINIGMNTALLPVVGVTLPFVSYGGSSLMSNFIFLGIISSMSAAAKKRRNVLEIK